MVRTQIQLPDELFQKAKLLAEQKEISLAEVVRRGLEQLLQIHPPERSKKRWKLAAPVKVPLRSDPFQDPEWRAQASLSSGAFEILQKSKARPSR